MKYYEEVEHIFTPGDCRRLIDLAEKNGMDEYEKDKKKFAKTSIVDRDLAIRLFKQLRDHYPRNYRGCKIIGFNDRLRIFKYYPGYEHNTHRDNFNFDSFGNIGVLTLNIFLNDDFEGGGLDFLDDNERLEQSLEPKTGFGVIFDFQQLHRAKSLKGSCKYMLRTDLVVRNVGQFNMVPGMNMNQMNPMNHINNPMNPINNPMNNPMNNPINQQMLNMIKMNQNRLNNQANFQNEKQLIEQIVADNGPYGDEIYQLLKEI